jgi:hypothetical protein
MLFWRISSNALFTVLRIVDGVKVYELLSQPAHRLHLHSLRLVTIATEAVGNGEEEIRTGIDPAEVLAHGAATYARIVREQRDDEGLSDCHFVMYEYYTANERVKIPRFA